MTNPNNEISLQQAVEMTARYRPHRLAQYPLSESFPKEAVQQLLAVPACTFLRIYYGEKEDGSVHAILVAGDAEGNDLLPPDQVAATPFSSGEKPLILEDAIRCPPDCPKPSPLNP
jgi:hypothetical protein